MGAQSIQRAALLIRLIASHSRDGLRLSDIVTQSRLEHSTTHRILKCLIVEGFVSQEAESRRYFLGPLVFELGLAAAPQFKLVDICRPSLQRIAERTGDTVFLTIRSGLDSVCLDRREGPFPIRALMLEVGTRRPLGVGAGGLALMAELPDEAVNEILSANAERYASYGKLTVARLRKLIERARALGYSLNDTEITSGAISVGLPLVSRWRHPFAAISVGAIAARMSEARQKEIAAILRAEVDQIDLGTSGLDAREMVGGRPAR